ncbi:hypothetical protein KPH14_006274 [Odynerus spinipes]|uniref:Retrovirus-related Pol polyprotein from transposon TNT 1-94-like beta-barrel domain-containing protein n=1 Tax=Odynerus spinipes TaxID=1348599 RepID=A0AAD9RCA2_9HYME|nr:hypothetical protein KPH14_006274 [Odynerus spinipes]
MYNIKELEVPIKIKVVKSGSYLIAGERGDIKGTIWTGSQRKDIIVSDVLIVPNLETNLISVRKLKMKGFRVIFDDFMN